MFRNFRRNTLEWFISVLRRLSARLSERQMMAVLAVVVGLLAGAGTCIFEALLHGVKTA